MSILQLFIRSVSDIPRLLELVATTVLLPAIVLLVTIDVSIRSANAGALSWSHELLGLLLLVFFLLGLPYCAQRNELINVDLFARFFPANVVTWIDRLSNLLSASIGSLLSYQAAVTSLDMHIYSDGMTSLPVPLWPFSCAVAALAAVWSIDQLRLMLLPGSRQ